MDIQVLLWLQNLRGGALDSILMAITDFVASPVMYVFVAVLYWCYNKRAATFLAMNLSFGSLVNQGLKNTFCVYRPWIRNPQVVPLEAARKTATGYSFPSGHTQIASSEFLSLAYWQKQRKWVVSACVFMTLLVMFTRMYLGVHTPQDVLASLAVSLVVIFLNARLLSWIESGKNRDIWVFVIGCVIAAAFLTYTTVKAYPMDYGVDGRLLVNSKEMITDCYAAAGCVFGFLIGFIAEHRLVKFNTAVSGKVRLLRGVFGAIILYIFSEFCREPLAAMHMYWGELFFFLFAFLYILFLYPALFSLWERYFMKKKKRTA